MAFEQLPKDPLMLLSVINTKLRDIYPSFEALCDDLHVNAEVIQNDLKAISYEYNRELNRFV